MARTLLADFPVLVLDEPTEHLDTAAADELMAMLFRITNDRATLIITHRLTGLAAAEEIVLLESGRVAERGRHEDLVGQGGRYCAAVGHGSRTWPCPPPGWAQDPSHPVRVTILRPHRSRSTHDITLG